MVAESLVGEDLTPLQWTTLACIDRIAGIDQRRLAESVGIVPVNASQVVDQLETMGLVDRRINGADRRARELHLTPRGKKTAPTSDSQKSCRQCPRPCTT